MLVLQVKRLNDQTTVVWTTPNGQHAENHDLTNCPDVPNEEFLDIMETVEADLVARTGFGTKFAKGLKLTGISVSKNAAGRRQFVPTVKIDFGWGEIGAPMALLLEPDEEGKRTTGKNVLTANELKNIEEFLLQGGKYADGERHQGGLQLEESA